MWDCSTESGLYSLLFDGFLEPNKSLDFKIMDVLTQCVAHISQYRTNKTNDFGLSCIGFNSLRNHCALSRFGHAAIKERVCTQLQILGGLLSVTATALIG